MMSFDLAVNKILKARLKRVAGLLVLCLSCLPGEPAITIDASANVIVTRPTVAIDTQVLLKAAPVSSGADSVEEAAGARPAGLGTKAGIQSSRN